MRGATSDALRRQFLSEVSRQLIDAEQLDGYDREAALEELTTPVSSVRRAGLTVRRENVLRAAVSAALVALLVFLGLKFGLTVQESALGSVIAAVVTLAASLISPLGQVFDIKYETVTRPRLEDPERFTEKFEDLLAHLKAERRTAYYCSEGRPCRSEWIRGCTAASYESAQQLLRFESPRTTSAMKSS